MFHLVERISTSAKLLHENKNGQSVKLLGETLRSLLQHHQADILSGDQTAASSAQAFHLRTVTPPCIASELVMPPDSSCFFYQKAFYVESTGAKTATCSDSKFANQLAAIVMYNMGLGYHREGILRGSSVLLRKALTMYRPALTILQACSIGDIERTLLMAITNNLGHIHAMHFDLKRVKECQDRLAALISTSSSDLESDEEHEIVSFFLQSFLFASSGPCTSPAA